MNKDYEQDHIVDIKMYKIKSARMLGGHPLGGGVYIPKNLIIDHEPHVRSIYFQKHRVVSEQQTKDLLRFAYLDRYLENAIHFFNKDFSILTLGKQHVGMENLLKHNGEFDKFDINELFTFYNML